MCSEAVSGEWGATTGPSTRSRWRSTDRVLGRNAQHVRRPLLGVDAVLEQERLFQLSCPMGKWRARMPSQLSPRVEHRWAVTRPLPARCVAPLPRPARTTGHCRGRCPGKSYRAADATHSRPLGLRSGGAGLPTRRVRVQRSVLRLPGKIVGQERAHVHGPERPVRRMARNLLDVVKRGHDQLDLLVSGQRGRCCGRRLGASGGGGGGRGGGNPQVCLRGPWVSTTVPAAWAPPPRRRWARGRTPVSALLPASSTLAIYSVRRSHGTSTVGASPDALRARRARDS